MDFEKAQRAPHFSAPEAQANGYPARQFGPIFWVFSGTVEENTGHFEVLVLFLSLSYGDEYVVPGLFFFKTNELTDFISFISWP